MVDSVRFERCQQVQLYPQSETMQDLTTSTSAFEEPSLNSGNVLCSHDGVLLKKASAQYISELNNSGALSLVEYNSPRRRHYIEWHPNENILIANDSQDQEDWSLVDTISRRSRTISECKVFNQTPVDNFVSDVFLQTKSRGMRTLIEELSAIEVKHRGQNIRFLRNSDDSVHSEFFFQHGNADLFVNSMRQLHFIDNVPSSRGGEEYVILPKETQKLKKTFAELDIGEIKSGRLVNESWLPNKVVGFLVNIPDYVQPPFQRSSSKQQLASLIHGERRTSPDNYEIVGLNRGTNSESSLRSESRADSAEKSVEDCDLKNVKILNRKIANSLPERQVILRGDPLNETQWIEFQTLNGQISDTALIKDIIFHGGVVYNLRSEVWKYLLNYYQWSDTEVERIQRRKEKSIEYYNMKAQWLSMTTAQEANFSGYRERKCQIEKDVKRTDRSQKFFAGENNPNLMVLQGVLMTYVMYNFDLGYVQGMSDLLAPILEIQGNEVDTFWCFVGFMDMVSANFDIDQTGMKIQFAQLRRLLEFANNRLFKYMQTQESDNMYFCFRWLLVWYKREVNNDDIFRLWECFWTRVPCKNFYLLFSIAILDQESNTIIENNYGFTEILKHVNELAGCIDVKYTLELAEAIYLQLKTSDSLPNDIRQIIGEPLQPNTDNMPLEDDIQDFTDEFDEIAREMTTEEKQQQQELLEEACERSMFLQYV